MTAVNWLLTRAVDRLFDPLARLPVLVQLSIVSLVTAAAVLLVIRAASNQRALAAIKRQIHADVFEIRLFNDDIRAMLRAQAAVLRHNATYLRLSLAPMLWIAIPLVLLMAQLETRFGYARASAGQPLTVTAQVKAPMNPHATLEVPAGLRVQSPAIWLPALRQVVWVVVAERADDYVLAVRVDGESDAKTLSTAEGAVRRSPVRLAARLFDEVIYPSEAPLPAASPFESIRVGYAEADVELFGWRIGWMIVYLLESMLFALLLRAPLRVTI